MHSPVEQSGKVVMLAKNVVLKLMWQFSCTASKWLTRGSAAGAWSFPFRGTLSILYWTLPRSWLPLDCQWLGYFSRLPSTIPVPCEFLPFFVILDGFPTDVFDSLYLVVFQYQYRMIAWQHQSQWNIPKIPLVSHLAIISCSKCKHVLILANFV